MNTSDGGEELSQIARRYEARKTLPSDWYSVTSLDNLTSQFHVDRALIDLLKRAELTDFNNMRLLEVGCGTGTNLLRFLRWGFKPENITANELLPDRVDAARAVLPSTVEVVAGDARDLPGDGAFDIVYQSTVLSSILDDKFQQQVAATMWRLTRPGGAVLSYDFAFNNPRNKGVRGVPISRLKELFGHSALDVRRVTLAPPLARRFGRHRIGYAVLNAVPLLRTHRVVLIPKPLDSANHSEVESRQTIA